LQQQVLILTKLTKYATIIVSQSTRFGIVITTMTTSIDGENGHTTVVSVQQ
jgi:hypothetical protein